MADDAKTALFLLGVRDSKANPALVYEVTKKDPEWVQNFVTYLRSTVTRRTAALVIACEYVKAGGPNGRRLIDTACVRPDQPGEVLAYWQIEFGRPIPSAVKRGLGDAARRLYTERNQIKYDLADNDWRWADVIHLARVKPANEQQNTLFGYLLDSRYNPDSGFYGEALPVLGLRRDMLAAIKSGSGARWPWEN